VYHSIEVPFERLSLIGTGAYGISEIAFLPNIRSHPRKRVSRECHCLLFVECATLTVASSAFRLHLSSNCVFAQYGMYPVIVLHKHRVSSFCPFLGKERRGCEAITLAIVLNSTVRRPGAIAHHMHFVE